MVVLARIGNDFFLSATSYQSVMGWWSRTCFSDRVDRSEVAGTHYLETKPRLHVLVPLQAAVQFVACPTDVAGGG